jgi:FSR family fosmidomycin resistance protein-like MFS transporter
VSLCVFRAPVYSILFSIAFAHLLNDLMQSVIPASYPILKDNFNLVLRRLGLLRLPTYSFFTTAVYRFYTDKKPKPYSLVIGMLFTISGLTLLSFATHFWMILAAVISGVGSSIFTQRLLELPFRFWRETIGAVHFQLGGNTGSAIGPLLVAVIVARSVLYHLVCDSWFLGIWVLKIAVWYQNHLSLRASKDRD